MPICRPRDVLPTPGALAIAIEPLKPPVSASNLENPKVMRAAAPVGDALSDSRCGTYRSAKRSLTTSVIAVSILRLDESAEALFQVTHREFRFLAGPAHRLDAFGHRRFEALQLAVTL